VTRLKNQRTTFNPEIWSAEGTRLLQTVVRGS